MSAESSEGLSETQSAILENFLDLYRGVNNPSLPPHIKATIDREAAHVRGAMTDLGLKLDSRDTFFPVMVGALLGADWTARMIAEGQLAPSEAAQYLGMLLAKFFFEETREQPAST